MYIVLANLFLFISGVISYFQNEYIIQTERMETLNNVPGRGSINSAFFKYNRTYTALNFTMEFKMDVNYDLETVVQAYKMASNEYRFFPLTFTENICPGLKINLFGLRNLYNCGNLTDCPIKKGVYLVCNWGPDYSKFPPHIPYGQYRIDVKFQHASKELFTYGWYVKVFSKDPLKN